MGSHGSLWNEAHKRTNLYILTVKGFPELIMTDIRQARPCPGRNLGGGRNESGHPKPCRTRFFAPAATGLQLSCIAVAGTGAGRAWGWRIYASYSNMYSSIYGAYHPMAVVGAAILLRKGTRNPPRYPTNINYKTPRGLEATKPVSRPLRSLQNLIGISSTVSPRCLLNLKATIETTNPAVPTQRGPTTRHPIGPRNG